MMQELLLRVAEDGVVTTGLPGQSLRFSFVVEWEAKKMTFPWIWSSGDDDRTIGFIEIDEFIEIEINRRDRAHQRTIGRMQLDLPCAISLRGPKKLATISQPDR